MKDVTVNYTYTRMPGYLVKEICFVIKVNNFFLIGSYLVLNENYITVGVNSI